MAHSFHLGADITAPTGLTDGQKHFIATHLKVKHLVEKNQRLTRMIWEAGYTTIAATCGKQQYREKMKGESKLNCKTLCLRTALLAQAWKQHFRNADTNEFNWQIHRDQADTKVLPPVLPELQIKEWQDFVLLACTVGMELTEEEQFTWQCESIIIWSWTHCSVLFVLLILVFCMTRNSRSGEEGTSYGTMSRKMSINKSYRHSHLVQKGVDFVWEKE